MRSARGGWRRDGGGDGQGGPRDGEPSVLGRGRILAKGPRGGLGWRGERHRDGVV